MNHGGLDESDTLAHGADSALTATMRELACGALETTTVIWQIEDDLVCMVPPVSGQEHEKSVPAYLESMAARALLHPNDHAELNAAVSRCLARNMPIVTVDLRVRTPEGWLPVTARMRGMAFDEGSHITRIVAMLHPVTSGAALQALSGRDRPLESSAARPAPGGLTEAGSPALPGASALSGFLAAQAGVMKMVLHGDDLQAILEEVARLVEQLAPESLCSVLLGMLSPAMFIPIAETSGDIMEIGNWVLNEACRQLAAWRTAGEVILPIAINLSARQFADPALAAHIESAIRRHDLNGELLELEVTESLVIEDAARAVKVLSALQAIGVRIAVDDFGTGYSSLAQLKRFPVNSLKIDRSFVQDVPGEQNDAAIVKAIIAMGHALHLKVIAEGVETPDQLAFLQRHDCDAIQGYYLSQPLSVDQLREFMDRHHAAALISRPA